MRASNRFVEAKEVEDTVLSTNKSYLSQIMTLSLKVCESSFLPMSFTKLVRLQDNVFVKFWTLDKAAPVS